MADLFDIAVAKKLAGSSGGGGGGSSDFSMANVTVTNSTPAMEWIGVINPIAEDALGIDFEIIQGTNEFQCVLYKGFGWIDMLTLSQQGLTITVSGNATYGGEGNITVTGDCTITISQVAQG